MGVAGQAIADQFGVDLGAALLRVLVLLEDDDAGALGQHEAVAILVIGARRLLRRLVEAVESARAAQNPAIASRQIGNSVPPATITSASPSMISREASPIACAPVEHAVTTEWLGPLRPCSIET